MTTSLSDQTSPSLSPAAAWGHLPAWKALRTADPKTWGLSPCRDGAHRAAAGGQSPRRGQHSRALCQRPALALLLAGPQRSIHQRVLSKPRLTGRELPAPARLPALHIC